MIQVAAIFAPLLLLLPGATAVHSARGLEGAGLGDVATDGVPEDGSAEMLAQGDGDLADGLIWTLLANSFRAPSENQVRIEQRLTIRIAPRGAAPPPQFNDLRRPRDMETRFEERRIGNCLPIGAIAGVQPGGENRLMLFMRDHRLISAELEKTCKARDFYSGFYLERNADSQICVDRDKLQSRSGANCVVKRLRQLIEADD